MKHPVYTLLKSISGELCFANPLCFYWTWIEDLNGLPQYCNQKSGSSGYSDLEGVISGERGCKSSDPDRIPSLDLTEVMKVYISTGPTSKQCEPYSQLACIIATLSSGYQVANLKNSGSEFAGNWGLKGCVLYTGADYTGLTFYGIGGTVAQMQDQPNYPGTSRPRGHDCN